MGLEELYLGLGKNTNKTSSLDLREEKAPLMTRANHGFVKGLWIAGLDGLVGFPYRLGFSVG